MPDTYGVRAYDREYLRLSAADKAMSDRDKELSKLRDPLDEMIKVMETCTYTSNLHMARAGIHQARYWLGVHFEEGKRKR